MKLPTKLAFYIIILCIQIPIYSQQILVDSIKKDSGMMVEIKNKDSVPLPTSPTAIESKIIYKAKDSIVYDVQTKMMYLYNKSNVDYTDIHIDAYYIKYDWTKRLLHADQRRVSQDSVIGKPYLKQAGKDYFTESMIYNFETKKGKVKNIVTQENDAILHGKEVKKDSLNNWYIKDAKYTSCTHDTPHFYFHAKRLKLTNKKSIITGPTNLTVREVGTPLVLPFGIFPANNGRRAGIILPKQYGFGDAYTSGFNLREMGFYIPVNEYIDTKFEADVYFTGGYALRNETRYNKMYKYDGRISFLYQKLYTNQDPDNPASQVSPDFGITWDHSQNQKAHPTFSFNSRLNFQTQGLFNRSFVTDPRRQTGLIQSNLNVVKRFRNSPFLLTGSISYNQNLITKTVDGSLPTIRANYNGNPIKISANPTHFLNNLNLQYATEFISNLPSTSSEGIFSAATLDKLSYGVSHTAALNFGGLKLFKYLNLTPSINYNDRFYFKSREIHYENSRLDTATKNGFYTVRDFSTSLSLNTVLSGYYLFGKKSKVIGIKHLLTPAMSLSYTPNFSSDFWGYYRQYNKNDTIYTYYPYLGPLSSISPGQSAIVTFGINNSFEGKFKSNKDSTTGFVKRMLLDALNFGGSYNLNADSFKLSRLGLTFSNSSLGFLTLSGGVNLEPYVYEGSRRIDKLGILNGQGLGRIMDATAILGFNLRQSDFSKRLTNLPSASQSQLRYLQNNFQYFYDFNSPWNLNMSYNLNIRNDFTTLLKDTTIVSMNLFLNNFDINITKNWKLAINSQFNVSEGSIGLTNIRAVRNMHCWEFAIQFTPISNLGGQAYLIEIRPLSGLLQDLKLSRNRPVVDSYF